MADELRDKNRRYAETASRGLFIKTINVLPDGYTANAETAEIWYTPMVSLDDGAEIARTDAQLNLYTPVQFYILRKENGQWAIANNPAPVAPSVPSATRPQ